MKIFDTSDPRRKRQGMYIGLLIAAVVLAVINRGGVWLAAAIAAGVLYDEISSLLTKRRRERKAKEEGEAPAKLEDSAESAERDSAAQDDLSFGDMADEDADAEDKDGKNE